MHRFRDSRVRVLVMIAAPLFIITMASIQIHRAQAQSNSTTANAQSDGELISGFRHVEVASVSDALEQITGKKMYMSHRMQPVFTAKFAGFARTVLLKKDEGNKDPEALTGMLEPSIRDRRTRCTLWSWKTATILPEWEG